jgi:hypothetical protein
MGKSGVAPRRTSQLERRRRFKWATSERSRRILKLIADRHPNVDASIMTEEWWRCCIFNQRSKLLVVCRKCGHRCDTSQITNIQQGHGFGCLCNGGVPWSTLAGRERMLKIIEERHPDVDASQMAEEWWLHQIVGAHSKLLVVCRKCEHRCDTSSISSIQQDRGFGCLCNGGVSWSTLAGRERMLKIIEERHPDVDASIMTEGWWRCHIVDCHSKLLVVCRKCEHRCDTSQITDIQQGQGFGCFCRHKTEAKLRRWLESHFGEVRRRVGECYSAATGRRLPFDFAMSSRVIFVELDGNIGHFGVGFRGEETRAVAERDLMKERWALENDHSVVRVLQTSVWADTDDWEAYLLWALRSASLGPKILHPAAPQYDLGIYAELRAACD